MIIKNSTLNGITLLVPGIFFIPAAAILSRELGVESFGILLLMYSVLGYSSIFDAGMTRAVIRKIAQSTSQLNEKKIIGTSLIFILVISSLPCFLIIIFSENFVKLLNVGQEYLSETNQSLVIVAFAIPCFLVSSVSFSYLEGKEKFLELAIYKIISGFFLAILPALMSVTLGGLVYAAYGLLIARVISVLLALLSIKSSLGIRNLRFCKYTLKELITFGGWISLSNIVSPIMSYMDRFLLTNSIGPSFSVFYVASSDFIEKLSAIPGALAKTIFPLFSRVGTHSIFIHRIYIGLSIVLFFVITPIFIFSQEILNVWLGPPFGDNSQEILKILLVGFFFNSLAQIPYAAIQSYGYAKLTALLHLAELIPYLYIFFYFVTKFGLIGAAYAWSCRVIIDFLFLLYFSEKFNKNPAIGKLSHK
jgi:O-antigen/teichoic acid export membrane protein